MSAAEAFAYRLAAIIYRIKSIGEIPKNTEAD
jgi:hypothetical protein